MAKKPAVPKALSVEEKRKLRLFWDRGEKAKAAAFAWSLEKAGKHIDASAFPGLSDLYVKN